MSTPADESHSTAEQVRAAYREGTRATIVAVLVSATLATLKIGAGILGNSYALVADGVESVLDIFSGLSGPRRATAGLATRRGETDYRT